MEVVGGVASTVALVETGLKLAQSLKRFISDYKQAAGKLEAVALNVQLLSGSVKEAEIQIRRGKDQNIYNDEAIGTFNGLCAGVKSSYEKIEKLVSGLNAKGGNAPGIGEKVSWAFGKKKEMEELRRDLEDWKTSLQIMLGVLNLKVSQTGVSRDQDTVWKQKLEIDRLMRENADAKRRYLELLKMRGTNVTITGFALPKGMDPPRGMNMASAGQGTKIICPSPQPKVPRSLLACAQAVQDLAAAIDAAMANWDDQDDSLLNEIAFRHDDVSEHILRLKRRQDAGQATGGARFSAPPIPLLARTSSDVRTSSRYSYSDTDVRFPSSDPEAMRFQSREDHASRTQGERTYREVVIGQGTKINIVDTDEKAKRRAVDEELEELRRALEREGGLMVGSRLETDALVLSGTKETQASYHDDTAPSLRRGSLYEKDIQRKENYPIEIPEPSKRRKPHRAEEPFEQEYYVKGYARKKPGLEEREDLERRGKAVLQEEKRKIEKAGRRARASEANRARRPSNHPISVAIGDKDEESTDDSAEAKTNKQSSAPLKENLELIDQLLDMWTV